MKDCTEIVVILDKSSSMNSLKMDAIEGFNNFLSDQRTQPGDANLTLILFDTTYNMRKSVPVGDVEPLNDRTYKPGGATALLDAMAKAINETGARLAALPEDQRPDKVIVVTITDGEENSSKEFNRSKISNMIRHQEDKYNWCFIYLGANVDAFHEAGQMGIAQAQAVNFNATPGGLRSAYLVGTRAVSGYRSEGDLPANWKAELEEADGDCLSETSSSSGRSS